MEKRYAKALRVWTETSREIEKLGPIVEELEKKHNSLSLGKAGTDDFYKKANRLTKLTCRHFDAKLELDNLKKRFDN